MNRVDAVGPPAECLARRVSVMRDLEPSLEALLPLMRPVDECWQPSDVLPKMGTEGWADEIAALRSEAARLTDEMLVVLVGNVVTEEALPSYLAALNRFGGMTDATGTDEHPWARFGRMWTAEEKRHGDVTRAYLYLSGRVDMRSVEMTVQHLLRNGFDTRAGGDPYRGIAYAAFQEHATKRAWSQLGGIAGSVGAPTLHKICGIVAADEARHERTYVAVLRDIVARDPVGALEALEDTLCHSIAMPARTMSDGHDRRLFSHFADVGQRLGVYTLTDYAENLTQLVATLGLASMTGLPAEAEAARESICSLPARHRLFAAERAAAPVRPLPFRWIHGRRA
jgi:acyl-[acyl-carrier-protein] desaturase